MSLPEALISSLEEKSEEPVIDAEGRVTTGRELLSRAKMRAQQLDDAGAGGGDVVLVGGGRGGDFWIDVLAVWARGSVYAPIDDSVDIAFATQLTGAKFVLGIEPSDLPSDITAITALGETPPEGLHGTLVVAPRAPDALSTILFTSGSTGRPKGVMLTDGGILANALATREVLDLRPSDKLFIAIPFRFVSALSHVVVSILSGATLAATEESPSPAAFSRQFEKTGSTCIGGGPIYARWVADAEGAGFGGLRWIMSSGDALIPSVIDRLEKQRPGLGIYTFYGLTELAGRFCFLPPGDQGSHAGFVGRPIPGFKLRVLDDDGQPCAVGEIGKVYADGPGLMLGYVNDTEMSAEALTEYGFCTGDLGAVDDAGVLRLHGRKDDVFKVLGQKANSAVIEDAVLASGLVADAAVHPVEDPTVGLVPAVFYVALPDMTFDRGGMMRHLRRNIDAYMLPRRFTGVPAIPRTRSGKVDRTALKALADETGDDRRG